tara:strand:+ start:103 stop:552 length:450 start_codon:yes stop_codon:yes gene_type:complete
MTYEQFIKRIKKQGYTLDQAFKLAISRLKSELISRARMEVTQTGWPNLRTGGLFRSIRAEDSIKPGSLQIALSAGSNIKYAGYVEFGTMFMQRRLYMNRAVYNWQKGRSAGTGAPGHGVYPVNRGMGKAGAGYRFLADMLGDHLKGRKI